jgi:hypothetical protein
LDGTTKTTTTTPNCAAASASCGFVASKVSDGIMMKLYANPQVIDFSSAVF